MRTLLFLLACAAALRADTVVLSDRSVLEGPVRRAGEELVVGEEKVPVASIFLWEDEQGVVKLDTPLRKQLEAYRVLAKRETLRLCLERLSAAVDAKAAAAARALLARAETVGLAPRRAEEWQARIEALGQDGAGDFPVPGPEVRADLLVARAVANGAKDWEQRGLEFLRAAFRIDEEHAGAKQLLAEIAPSRWKIGDARTWLDWKVDVLPDGVRILKRRHPDMERARATWGRDVHGVETPEIVFITKMKRSAPVRMCLRYARLTCRALDKMFSTPNPRHEENLPLVIYFYPDQKEYVQNASGGQPAAAKWLGLTLGFYTPGENISRFFWPNVPEPEQSVRDTFVHELTHHWIQRRCPRWHPRDVSSEQTRVTVPGYWIVEGFAVFIQEGRYDIETGKWTHFNPHARCIDVTAALAKEKKLIDWDKAYPLKQSEFRTKLDTKKPFAHFRTKWTIRPQAIMEIRLFYEQSGATCFFLYWGEGGKYRERLLDYVTNYYTAKPEHTSIEAAFGMTPKELGTKVEKWCIDVIDRGWRP